MNDIDVAWCSGLFEGEGCLREDKYPELMLAMTDKDVVTKFGRILGVPSLVEVERPEPRKTIYRWCCRKREDVRRILSLMLPYFGDRRAYKALNILDSLELV